MLDSHGQKSLYGLRQRVRRRLASIFSTRFLKTQEAYELTLNGHRYKRLRVPDSYIAAQIESNLAALRTTNIFPRLVRTEGNELLLEFIEGQPIGQPDDEVAAGLSRTFAAIYKAGPKWTKTSDIDLTCRSHTDLQFLNRVGVLDGGAFRRLEKALDDAVPSHVWQGYDYTDAHLKNFVRTHDGSFRIFDVESLRRDYLIGSGVVKALAIWAEPFRNVFLTTLKEQRAPDFTEYLTYVELCYLSNWVARAYLQGKRRILEMSVFDRFL